MITGAKSLLNPYPNLLLFISFFLFKLMPNPLFKLSFSKIDFFLGSYPKAIKPPPPPLRPPFINGFKLFLSYGLSNPIPLMLLL